jgi:hypothetical protein
MSSTIDEKTQVKRFGKGQKLAFGLGSYGPWFINSAFKSR